MARRALLAGKHVLLEKAFTTTAAEARELAALAAEQGRFLMEAMWMRFNPAIQRVLEEIAAGAIGDVRTVQAGFGFPPPPDAIHWRPDLGGGALLDMGVYPLSFAHLVMGVPDSVEATGEMRDDGLDITASVFLRYGDGRFAHALTSLAGPGRPGGLGRRVARGDLPGRAVLLPRVLPRADAPGARRPAGDGAARAAATCRCSGRSARRSPTACSSTRSGRWPTRSPSWRRSTRSVAS